MTARAQMAGRPTEWLLRLEVAGRVFRFATRALDVVEADGRSHRYVDALDVGDVRRSEISIAITVLPVAIDWAELAAWGVSLASGTAALYRYWVGLELEQCECRAVGPVCDPEWGAPNEPMTFSIDLSIGEDAAVIPSPFQRIDESTWPVTAFRYTDEPAIGACGPIVIGCPGGAGFSPTTSAWTYIRTGGTVAAAPAYLVERVGTVRPASNGGTPSGQRSAKLLIAYHEVQATEVCVADLSDGTAEPIAVSHTTDLRGARVAYVDFATTPTVRAMPGHEYATAWKPGQGGALRRDRSGILRGAGEVIDYLLSEAIRGISPGVRFGGRYDAGRQQAQRPYLDRFLVDAVINEAVPVNDWIKANLGILPIEWVRGPGGWYWQAWRYDAQAHEAVAVLDTSKQRLRRVSRFREPAPEYSRFVLDYGRVGDGIYQRRKVLSGAVASPTADDRPSWRCAVAETRIAARSGLSVSMSGAGVRTLSVQSDAISDDATADRVLDAWAARFATPPTPVAYEGEPDLEALNIGDIVLVTDAESYLSGRVALVRDVIPGDWCTLELELLADTGRRA